MDSVTHNKTIKSLQNNAQPEFILAHNKYKQRLQEYLEKKAQNERGGQARVNTGRRPREPKINDFARQRSDKRGVD